MRNLTSLLALLLLAAGCAEGDSALLMQNRSAAEYDDSTMPPLAPGGEDDDDDAASTGDDDDDATESGPDEDPNYALDITSILPAPDSIDHHYRQPIVVSFTGYAAGVQLYIVNEEGDRLDTVDTWNEDFTELSSLPAEAELGSPFLRPLHSYEVGVDIGNTSLSWTFTTSAIGQQVLDPDSLHGRTYAVSFAEAHSPDSAPLAQLIASVQGPTWLWQVDLSGGNVDFNSGVGTEDDADADGFNQDMCTRTGLVGGADAGVELVTNPYFASPPGDFSLWLDDQQLQFEQGWIDGDFLGDGSALLEVAYRGWLRADSLVALIGDDACALLDSQAGLQCEACPSGDGDCAWVHVAGVSGVETDLELAEVAADADCSDGDGLPVLSCSTVDRSGAFWLLLPLLALVRRR